MGHGWIWESEHVVKGGCPSLHACMQKGGPPSPQYGSDLLGETTTLLTACRSSTQTLHCCFWPCCGSQAEQLQEELVLNSIPCQLIGGADLWTRGEVQLAVAAAQLVATGGTHLPAVLRLVKELPVCKGLSEWQARSGMCA
jgi:hypothetical protein